MNKQQSITYRQLIRTVYDIGLIRRPEVPSTLDGSKYLSDLGVRLVWKVLVEITGHFTSKHTFSKGISSSTNYLRPNCSGNSIPNTTTKGSPKGYQGNYLCEVGMGYRCLGGNARAHDTKCSANGDEELGPNEGDVPNESIKIDDVDGGRRHLRCVIASGVES